MALRTQIAPKAEVVASKTVEEELVNALGEDFQARDKAETEQVYLKRIARGIASIDEEHWNALSDPAQAWFNKAADVMNTGTGKLDPLPEPAAVETKTKPEATAPAKEEKKAAAAAPAATKDKAEKTPEKSASVLVREFVCVNGSATAAEAVQYVKDNGKEISLSTAATVLFDTKKTIEILSDLGLLKEAD